MNELTSRLQNLEDIIRTYQDVSAQPQNGIPTGSQDPSHHTPDINGSSPASPSSRDGAENLRDNAEAITTATEKLDIDTEGKWDYYGNSSEIVFFQRMEDFFGSRFNGIRRRESVTSRISIPPLFEMKPSADDLKRLDKPILPPRKVADELISSALNEACTLEPIVHRPTFDRLYGRLFATSPLEYGPEEKSFVPLFYAVCALGSLFNPHTLERMDYECAILEGCVP